MHKCLETHDNGCKNTKILPFPRNRFEYITCVLMARVRTTQFLVAIEARSTLNNVPRVKEKAVRRLKAAFNCYKYSAAIFQLPRILSFGWRILVTYIRTTRN